MHCAPGALFSSRSRVVTFIHNAGWLTAEQGTLQGSLLIKDGLVSEISPASMPADLWDRPRQESIDAEKYLIIPGLIDGHVHFREPGAEHKEGIANGGRAALKGGVTTVLDMPNNNPVCDSHEVLELKRRLFSRSCPVGWGLHFQARADRPLVQPEQTASMKIYMARSSGNPGITRREDLARIFSLARTCCIHGEDETGFLAPGGPHHEVRPRGSITSALREVEAALCSLPASSRPRVVLCHMSTSDEVRWLERMKAQGFDLWGETCPHYLTLTSDDYLRRGARLQVNPPLRDPEDQAALLEGLARGVIDLIGTDHAPHLPEEKLGQPAPSGIPGIEWLAPVLMSLIDRGQLTMATLHQTLVTAPARCYGLKLRDGIKAGNRADLVFLARGPDPHNRIITKAGYEPFSFSMDWHVAMTMVGGRIRYLNGTFPDLAPEQEVSGGE